LFPCYFCPSRRGAWTLDMSPGTVDVCCHSFASNAGSDSPHFPVFVAQVRACG
jgi:hypothetical protein